MKAYFYLLLQRWRRLLFTADPVRFLVITLLGLILALVAGAVFTVSRGFFSFLTNLYPTLFRPFSLYLLQTALLVVYIFGLASYTFLFYRRFRAQENIIFWLSKQSKTLLMLKTLLETAALGSWPIFALITPAIIGFHAVAGASPVTLLQIYSGLFMYILLALLPAALLVLFFSMFGSAKISQPLILTMSALLFWLSFLLTRTLLPENLAAMRLEKLPVALHLLPSAQFARLIVNGNGWRELLTVATVMGIFFMLVSRRLTLTAWQKLQEGIFLARPHQPVIRKPTVVFPSRFPWLSKDMLQLLRRPSRWGYFLFILLITLIYSIMLAKAPAKSNALPFYTIVLWLGSLLIPAYLLLTLLMQLGFPGLRQELEHFFLCAGTQDKWGKLAATKLAFTLLIGFIFMSAALLVQRVFSPNHLRLNLPYIAFQFVILVMLANVVFLVGGAFTKLLRNELGDQTTNIPGLLATLTSLLIIVLAVLLFINYGSVVLLALTVLSLMMLRISLIIVKLIITTTDVL